MLDSCNVYYNVGVHGWHNSLFRACPSTLYVGGGGDHDPMTRI